MLQNVPKCQIVLCNSLCWDFAKKDFTHKSNNVILLSLSSSEWRRNSKVAHNKSEFDTLDIYIIKTFFFLLKCSIMTQWRTPRHSTISCELKGEWTILIYSEHTAGRFQSVYHFGLVLNKFIFGLSCHSHGSHFQRTTKMLYFNISASQHLMKGDRTLKIQ